MEYPIKFNDEEYDARLGLYQKWLHGDKNKKIKTYSMAAFQTRSDKFIQSAYQKYAEYLYLSASAIINNSDWFVRIYIDESVIHPENPDKNIWLEKLNLLMQDRVQIICVKFPRYYQNGSHEGLLPVMFRYLTLFDPNVTISLFRDIDNIWTAQHQYFIDTWLANGTDVCLYMNNNYKHQQAVGLTANGIILENKFYTTLLSGLWNIKNPNADADASAYPVSIWQKIFAYIESTNDFVMNPEYAGYKYYKNRFLYGFDELALSRVVLPIIINMGLKVYAIPVKIYDTQYFINLFTNPIVSKFLRRVSDHETLATVKDIIVNNYWHMSTENAGLSQYMLCIITNIYFGIIMQQSPFYTSETFINNLKTQIIPSPLLMSIGIFTFKNYTRYNWFPIAGKSECGSAVVNKFLTTNEPISLQEWTANSDLSNGGNGVVPVPAPAPKPMPVPAPQPTPVPAPQPTPQPAPKNYNI